VERDYGEIPELGDDWFARAVPNEGGSRAAGRGRRAPGERVSLRLSQRVIESFRAGGPGWQDADQCRAGGMAGS